MKVFFYCSHERMIAMVEPRPTLDPVFGNKQVHHCSSCGRLLGILEFTDEEIKGQP